ncbi:MAG: HMA2 domain-containing protein [Thermodesulfobacteriota bacterium]
MLPKPDARIVHALPGRVRFRVPGKKGDRYYFEELVAAISSCSGLEKLVINPATASVLIHYDAGHTGELNGFLEKNNFFQVADRPQQATPASGKKAGQPERSSARKKPETPPELSRMIGMGLIGWSCYQLMAGGFMSPPWHAALWYGYSLLRNNQQVRQGKPDTGSAGKEEEE